jgi:release factor H-coupled RctB family protein
MNTLTETNVRLFASPTTWVEGEAMRQLHHAAKLRGVRNAIGFPDLHPGKGVPVGAAFVTDGVIYPHLIGGDIGCGMAFFATDLLRRKAKLDRWAELSFDLEHPWEGNTRERLEREELCATQFAESFGTLGGGNHFAELQAVEKVFDREAFSALGLAKDELALLIHSGSRGFGQSVFETHLEEHGAGGVDADSDTATRYLLCHDHAMRWAEANRALIAERFLTPLGATGRRVLDACHNSVACRAHDGSTVWIHRKGAAPAGRSPVVILGSRGTFSYLVQPLAADIASGWSIAHGAGRKWNRSESRARSRERFHHDQLVQTGLGGRVICEDRILLHEESPLAYKNIEAVIQDLVDAGLISVIATLRPLLTYKTRKQRR